MTKIEIGKTYVVVSEEGVSAVVITATGEREVALLERIQLTPATITERRPFKVRFAHHR